MAKPSARTTWASKSNAIYSPLPRSSGRDCHACRAGQSCLNPQRVQAALGRLAANTPVEKLLNQRLDVDKQLCALVLPEADKIGIVVHAVEVKDVMVAGGLNRVAEGATKDTIVKITAARARGNSAPAWSGIYAVRNYRWKNNRPSVCQGAEKSCRRGIATRNCDSATTLHVICTDVPLMTTPIVSRAIGGRHEKPLLSMTPGRFA